MKKGANASSRPPFHHARLPVVTRAERLRAMARIPAARISLYAYNMRSFSEMLNAPRNDGGEKLGLSRWRVLGKEFRGEFRK